jgi:hypothetical protein
MDIVRLEGEGNYRKHPDKNFPYNVELALPEVMGGGNETMLPEYPYKDAVGNWIFGAPDGMDDGVIYVTTGSGWTRTR